MQEQNGWSSSRKASEVTAYFGSPSRTPDPQLVNQVSSSLELSIDHEGRANRRYRSDSC